MNSARPLFQVIYLNISELIKVRNEFFSLLEFQRPKTNYLMLENTASEQYPKTIFLIYMKGNDKLRIVRVY